MTAPAPSATVAPLWVAMTHHSAHLIERCDGEAMLLDAATPDAVRGRSVIVVPSAAKPHGISYAARRLRELGAARVAVVSIIPNGALDLADHIETSHANGRAVDLAGIAAAQPDGRENATPTKAVSTSQTSEAAYRRIADVKATPVRWLWKGRIARGKVILIVGHPGLGKSQVSLSLASIGSIAGLWPVDRTRAERGSIVILSAEDDAADTIRPRLEAASADVTRCYILDAVRVGYTPDGGEIRRGFSLERDLAALERMIQKIGDVALVIIDPLTAYLGSADSHKNADVRALLAPLAELAARHGVAVIAVSHLSKGQTGDALLRVSGSIAFAAAARAAFAVVRDPANHARRLFLPLKNNLASDESGLAFTVEGFRLPSGIETSRIVWEPDPVTVTADEALAPEVDREERSAVQNAKLFLADLLAEVPVPERRVKAAAAGAGYAWATIRRAKKALGVEAVKGGLKEGWTWRLPAKVLKTSEDAQEKNVSAFGTNEHLRESGNPAGDADAEYF